MGNKLSATDMEQMIRKGRNPERVKMQLERFASGFPYARLTAPAIPRNGIFVMDAGRVNHFAAYYSRLRGQRLLKFVPASGAASRMFSQLLAFKNLIYENGDIRPVLSDPAHPVTVFFNRITDFAFYPELSASIDRKGENLEKLLQQSGYAEILTALLDKSGLGYASLPKALLLFHRYDGHCRTAAEEHLAEAAAYCTDDRNRASLHFTLSPEHVDLFYTLMDRALPYFSERTGAAFRVDHSLQKPSTDTPAVTPELMPFRDEKGELVFRPGGHGALIENLNDLDADIIFIKNIDNVVPEYRLPDTVLYKSALAGLLAEIRDEVHHGLKQIADGRADHAACDKLQEIAETYFCLSVSPGSDLEKRCDTLFALLDRPIRVCGMVRNLGEPGGGPFFMKGSDGVVRLQIVESSQVHHADEEQEAIFRGATHFNPVDLVCSTRDYLGRPFDLHRFIDEETGFISEKSSGGRPLKAMELPGLWNGAMAGWNTVFAEVPVSTFNPVKTVNDLLRSEHIALFT